MATSKVPRKSRLTSSTRKKSSSDTPLPKVPPKTGNVRGSAIQFTNPVQPEQPQKQIPPLAIPTKDDIASGEKVLQSLIKKQKDKVVSVLERIATHNVDIITHGMEVSYEEYIKLHDEFLLSLNDKMENDVSEFKWVIDQYIKDLKHGRVESPKNILTKQELAEMGAIGTKEDLLRSAGSSISSFLRRGGPLTKQQLGIYDKLFEKQKQDEQPQADGFIGKAFEKIQSFTKLFKDPEIEEKQREDRVPEFDKTRFKKDEEYHKLMLDYTKDLVNTNKTLSKSQLEILRKVKKEEDLQKFVQGARERMSPGQQLIYDMIAGVGRMTKNLVRNAIDKIEELERETKQTPDHEPVDKQPQIVQATPDHEPVTTVESPPTWIFPEKQTVKNSPTVWRAGRQQKENVDEIAFERAAAEDESDDIRQDKILGALESIDKTIKIISESGVGGSSGDGGTVMPLGGNRPTPPTPTTTPKPKGRIARFASKAAGIGRIAAGALLSPVGLGVATVGALGTAGYLMNKINEDYSERIESQSQDFIPNKELEGTYGGNKFTQKGIESIRKQEEQAKTWNKLTPEEKAKRSEQKDISKISPVKEKDILSGQVELINRTSNKDDVREDPKIEFERAPKTKTENIDVLTETAETIKEEKRSAMMAEQTQQIINAPQKTTVISGGSQQTHMKQNPRNPDNSFTSWLKTRIKYI